eukprot:67973_1
MSSGSSSPPRKENKRTLALAFTCNQCNGRSTLMIGKDAYKSGLVICQCQKCGIRHIIADHTGLLNDTEFGRGNLQSYLEEKGRAGEMITKSVPQLSDTDLK